tara:strand:- start:405 stop:647 length:243 start_codon:yes stop_codon:yes gene_type:complete
MSINKLSKLLKKDEIINLELGVDKINLSARIYYKQGSDFEYFKSINLDKEYLTVSEIEQINLFIIDLLFKRKEDLDNNII